MINDLLSSIPSDQYAKRAVEFYVYFFGAVHTHSGAQKKRVPASDKNNNK